MRGGVRGGGGDETDLVVHLRLELTESEGGLVPVLLLHGVAGPGDDYAGPGVTVAAVRLLKYFSFLMENFLFILPVIFCKADDTALYWHSCPSSRIF